jgi:hypothetical protein
MVIEDIATVEADHQTKIADLRQARPDLFFRWWHL